MSSLKDPITSLSYVEFVGQTRRELYKDKLYKHVDSFKIFTHSPGSQDPITSLSYVEFVGQTRRELYKDKLYKHVDSFKIFTHSPGSAYFLCYCKIRSVRPDTFVHAAILQDLHDAFSGEGRVQQTSEAAPTHYLAGHAPLTEHVEISPGTGWMHAILPGEKKGGRVIRRPSGAAMGRSGLSGSPVKESRQTRNGRFGDRSKGLSCKVLGDGRVVNDLRCLRDLHTQNLPLLEHILRQGRRVLRERSPDIVSAQEPPVFVHYVPSTNHLHLYFWQACFFL